MSGYREALFINQQETGIKVFKTSEFELAYYSSMSENNKVNEDSGALLEVQNEVIAIVADGMGGHRNGEKASKTVVDSFRSSFKKGLGQGEDSVSRFIQSVDLAQKRVSKRFPGSGSTLVGAILSKSFVRFFNIGDSVGFLSSRSGAIKYRTIEHSPLGFAQESGLLEDEEIHQSESHFVSNVIGSSPMRIEASQKYAIAKSDTVLLASDGFYGNIDEEEMQKILRKRSIEETMEILVRTAMDRRSSAEGHMDDLTVVVSRRVG
jgi:serine/threonine protein phosphatase PrpC